VRNLALFLSILGLTGTMAMPASAAEEKKAASAAELSIGTLDWQSLLTKAPQAEKASKRLEKEFKARKEGIDEKQKTLETKIDKFQRDKDAMAATERTKAERELGKMQQDLRDQQEEFQNDYVGRQREEMDKFLSVVKDVVQKYAKEHHFDLILPQETTMYASEKINLTAAILEKLKQEK